MSELDRLREEIAYLKYGLAVLCVGRTDIPEYPRCRRDPGAKLRHPSYAPENRSVHRADRKVVMGELLAAIGMIIVVATFVAIALDAARRK